MEVQGFGVGSKIDLTNSTGVETLAVTNGTGGTAFTNVQAQVTVELSNTTGGISVQYAADVDQPAEGQDVVLNNVTSAGVLVNNATTFNVNSTGDNAAGFASGVKLETINVTGTGTLAIGAVAATLTTLNAADYAGGVTANLAATDDIDVTGGSGDDSFNFKGSLTTDDSVEGGDGFDTVGVLAGNYSAAADAAPFNALSSIERVSFNGPADVVLTGATFTNAGITNLLFNGTGNALINVAGSARTYEFGSDNGGDATFNMKAGATEINIDYIGDEGGTGATTDSLTVNLAATEPAASVSTINLTSTSDGDLAAGAFTETGVITARAGSTVNVSGDVDLDITGSTNNIIVDASTFESDLTVEGSTLAAGPGIVFVGAAPTAGVDTITLGVGSDSVEFSSGLSSGFIERTPGIGGANTGNIVVDVINGFQTGEDGDVLDFIGAGDPDAVYVALTTTQQDTVNAVTNLVAATTAASNAIAGAGWTAFDFNGLTYALYDDAANGFVSSADVLVQLNGVDVSELTQDNFA